MNKFFLNEKGVSLIEIMLSMTILSIVLVSFLAVFSQMMNQSSKIEDRLTAIHMAEKLYIENKNGTDRTLNEKINGKEYEALIESCKEKELVLKRVRLTVFIKGMDEPLTTIFGYEPMGEVTVKPCPN
ncbi:type IV pilus modification PilV family protein [Cytobacillus purgationiresistens]|uniref:Prepilin-type N-terminal cleavage/methylation domain-containing protein n=1 Tax=Cytobacillus purgationiresistens TaxID=863449 RepID=A0ABU0AFG8_9BACI|nr:prepilin-type N-terminal cleavage/methylation domain-containing protein [Cytobacillus purgationiresistens]MDQ0269993.1 prepilin-type N-terminal cleavage/methylation domain-containing protein [Cytobacillus purgationiresistens]